MTYDQVQGRSVEAVDQEGGREEVDDTAQSSSGSTEVQPPSLGGGSAPGHLSNPLDRELDQQEDVEEALAPIQARDPGCPTKAERDAHDPTHMPFRSWCEVCVEARQCSKAHKEGQDNPQDFTVPELSLDTAS